MSGEIDVTIGYTPTDGVKWSNADLAAMINSGVWRVQAGAIGTRELADGSITSDKLDSTITAQLGLADGSVTTQKLADDCLSADATGRGKMADDFLSADATGLGKMQDGFLTADAAGRAKMADSFMTRAKQATEARIPNIADVLAFSVHRTANQTSIPLNTATQVQYNVETEDNGSKFDTGTYRWTPGQLGRATMSAYCELSGTGSANRGAQLLLYKNGAVYKVGPLLNWGYTSISPNVAVFPAYISCSNVIIDDAADYFEIFIVQTKIASETIIGGITKCYWDGHMTALE